MGTERLSCKTAGVCYKIAGDLFGFRIEGSGPGFTCGWRLWIRMGKVMVIPCTEITPT